MPSLTATYRIVQQTGDAFYVVRTLSGEDVWPGEPIASLFGPFQSAGEASTFAAKASVRFCERYPSSVAVIESDACDEQRALVQEHRAALGRRAA